MNRDGRDPSNLLFDIGGINGNVQGGRVDGRSSSMVWKNHKRGPKCDCTRQKQRHEERTDHHHHEILKIANQSINRLFPLPSLLAHFQTRAIKDARHSFHSQPSSLIVAQRYIIREQFLSNDWYNHMQQHTTIAHNRFTMKRQRRRKRSGFAVVASLAMFVSALVADAFTIVTTRSSPSTTMLLAKKGKKNAAASAALEQLEQLEALADEPLSKKEQLKLEKLNMKKNAVATYEDDEVDDEPQLSRKELLKLKKTGGKAPPAEQPSAKADVEEAPKLSKKELMLQKALEMEERDMAASAADDDASEDAPKLSKKELKALQKKQEKEQAKLEKKQLAKQAAAAADEATDEESESVAEPQTVTLEDKIRKERPPPRIRVMEGVQPGFTSLRLENVGITFRNQEVLKDVTWGVQTGDRIGLVGANGAGT